MAKIGILNLQGAVSEHYDLTKKAVKNLGVNVKVESVRYAEDVEVCDGIILSGGESTVIGKLICKRGIDKVIKDNNIPVFGACAGSTGGGIKISALVVGSDDEGVAFVRDDENVDRLVRSGSVVSASLGGIKVDMKVKSVSIGGIELSTPKGGVFLNARFSSLDKTEGADRNFLRYIESESVKLGELVKLISDNK